MFMTRNAKVLFPKQLKQLQNSSSGFKKAIKQVIEFTWFLLARRPFDYELRTDTGGGCHAAKSGRP